MLFSEEAIGFLFENHTRDSKDWFKEHKADYHRLIEEPFAELITALTPIMNDIDSRIVCNPKKISRLYKDARYNKGGPIFRESVWCSLKCQRDKSDEMFQQNETLITFFELSRIFETYFLQL